MKDFNYCVNIKIIKSSRNFKGKEVLVVHKCNKGKLHKLFMILLGGEFGAYMSVHIENDGPVTLDIESPQFPPPKEVCYILQCMGINGRHRVKSERFGSWHTLAWHKFARLQLPPSSLK